MDMESFDRSSLNQGNSLISLVLATKNLHKVRELRSLLKEVSGLDILSLADFPTYCPAPEEGSSFEEIAKAKALHAAKALHKWVIAEDSGLVVPALKGAPGIYSARFASKEEPSDKENRKKLLQEMLPLQEEQRSAYYECAIALASPEGIKKCVRATCEGSIAFEQKGSQGFGYDPLFIKHGYHKTFGELEESIKNRVSHRRKAFDKLLPSLLQLAEYAVLS